MAFAIAKDAPGGPRPDAHYLLLAAALGAAAAGAGLWFAAWKNSSLVCGIAGSVSLLSWPALAVAGTPLRVAPVTAVDDATVAAATDRLNATDTFVRRVRRCRAVALIGLSSAGVMWVSQVWALIDAPRFVVGHSVVSAIAAAAFFPWLAKRERTALEIRADLRLSIAAFRSGRQWDTG